MEIEDLSWNEVTSKRFNHPLLPRSLYRYNFGKLRQWNDEKYYLLLFSETRSSKCQLI